MFDNVAWGTSDRQSGNTAGLTTAGEHEYVLSRGLAAVSSNGILENDTKK